MLHVSSSMVGTCLVLNDLVEYFTPLIGHSYPLMKDKQASIHAEQDAKRRYLRNIGRYMFESVDLFVGNFTKDGSMREARPCFHCLIKLERFVNQFRINLKNVYYTTHSGLMMERFIDMFDNHLTKLAPFNRRQLLNNRDIKKKRKSKSKN